MLADKFSEPLAQRAGLIRNLVQLSGCRAGLQPVQRIRRHKLGLSQPPQKSLAVFEPVDRSIERRRNRIEEIEAKRVADKNCWRFGFHNRAPAGVDRITGLTVLD